MSVLEIFFDEGQYYINDEMTYSSRILQLHIHNDTIVVIQEDRQDFFYHSIYK
jgi:hypothetical protein